MANFKIALVGVGQRGLQQLKALSELREEGLISIEALVDPFEENLKKEKIDSYISNYNEKGIKLFTDYEEMINSVDLDAIWFVIPPNQHKNEISYTAHGLLSPTDWYASRKAEAGTAIPSAVGTYRAAVRTKAADMHTKIDAADTVDKLAALYVYNTDNPPVRPLGEWPDPVE